MPSPIRFAEIQRLLNSHGWYWTRTNGSHRTFTRAGKPSLTVPMCGREKVKHVYLREAQSFIAKHTQSA